MGSPSHLAPEVLQGKALTFASDLWSLGIILYQMYTGHPPFLADSFASLKEKIIHKELPLPKVKGNRHHSSLHASVIVVVFRISHVQ